MAKITNGGLLLDPNDRIDFKDTHNITHSLLWDDNLSRFIFDGSVGSDQFVGSVNAVSDIRNPQPSDDSYMVPTIWINSITNALYILVESQFGGAVWRSLGGHKITINDGTPPPDNDPFDMWISIDPV